MLISPVPATPVAPVQSSRPSPVPVQGVASVEPVSPVADANEQLSRELDEALHAMDNLRSQLAASQARLSAASRSVAQQARQAAPTATEGGDTDLGTGSRRYVAQSALNQARQAQHSALSVSA
jgi:flagellin-like hook-associated protein FlgL